MRFRRIAPEGICVDAQRRIVDDPPRIELVIHATMQMGDTCIEYGDFVGDGSPKQVMMRVVTAFNRWTQQNAA